MNSFCRSRKRHITGAIEKLRKLPLVDWRHVWRTAERLGKATPNAPVIFECVGVPGMIDDVISGAPLFSRVVVVGVCMDNDAIRPAMAINKEIDLRFVLAYIGVESKIRWFFFWFIAGAIAVYFLYGFWVSPLRNKPAEEKPAS